MAPTATKSSGTRVQTWLPLSLAEQLKAQADPSGGRSRRWSASRSTLSSEERRGELDIRIPLMTTNPDGRVSSLDAAARPEVRRRGASHIVVQLLIQTRLSQGLDGRRIFSRLHHRQR